MLHLRTPGRQVGGRDHSRWLTMGRVGVTCTRCRPAWDWRSRHVREVAWRQRDQRRRGGGQVGRPRAAVISRPARTRSGGSCTGAARLRPSTTATVTPVPGLPTPVTFCEIFPPDDSAVLLYAAEGPDLEIRASELTSPRFARAGVFWVTGTGLSQERAAPPRWPLSRPRRPGHHRPRPGTTGRCSGLAGGSPALGTAGAAVRDRRGRNLDEWLHRGGRAGSLARHGRCTSSVSASLSSSRSQGSARTQTGPSVERRRSR